MKKAKIIVPVLILLAVAAITLSGCPEVVVTPSGEILIVGWFSQPVIYLSDGNNNFADPYNPVTGTAISDATITISNETTGVSTIAAWDAANERYVTSENLPHSAGQKVSLRVETSTETISGDPTTTPDPIYSNLSPSTGATVSLPFTMSWDVTQGTYEATHSWVFVAKAGSTNEAYTHQEVMPVSQTSFQVTSSHITTGEGYYLGVFGVNVMNLSGAKSGSVVYVGGGTATYSYSITVEAQ